VLLEHQVPAITTITATVRGDVTDMPDTILWWRGNEMGRASAIDADDRGCRRLCALHVTVR
jgi:hypothetical protein